MIDCMGLRVVRSGSCQEITLGVRIEFVRWRDGIFETSGHGFITHLFSIGYEHGHLSLSRVYFQRLDCTYFCYLVAN